MKRLLLPLLSGCSYVYDLKAIAINGRLAFIVDPHSRSGASCIRSIEVTAVGPSRATPAAGDDRQAVATGTFWKQTTASDQCLNPFPILYGVRLAGEPFVYEDRIMGSVAAKPLKADEIYEVSASGSGSGYGGVRFRIRRSGQIENLPRQ